MTHHGTGLREVIYEPQLVPYANPPLGKVVQVADVRGDDIALLTGNPHDQGTDWALIGPAINGATEFSIGLYKMGPNQMHPPHYHPVGPEFYYIVEGSCLVLVGEDWTEVGPETAIYLPEGMVHGVRTRDNESVTIVYGYDLRPGTEVSTVWLE